MTPPKKRIEILEKKMNPPEPIQIIVIDWDGNTETEPGAVIIKWDDEPDGKRE